MKGHTDLQLGTLWLHPVDEQGKLGVFVLREVSEHSALFVRDSDGKSLLVEVTKQGVVNWFFPAPAGLVTEREVKP